jgi:ERCC4-type nuclease
MTAAKTPPLEVLYDSREQTPFEPLPGVTLTRVTLETGDYTTELLQGIAAVERKSVSDFASSITHGRERFDDEVRRLRAYRWRTVIVEGDVSDISRVSGVHPNSVIGTVASFQARSDLPCLFAGSRLAAARLTFGLLRRWQERLEFERKEVSETDPDRGRVCAAQLLSMLGW